MNFSLFLYSFMKGFKSQPKTNAVVDGFLEPFPLQECSMNHLNTILIEGNLTRDPQTISAKEGCSFTIANNRYYLKDGKWVNEASFFVVFAYGKLGDSCLKYLTKGRGVRVCGRLKQFTSKRSSIPQDFVFIIAEHVEFQPSRNTEKPATSEESNTPKNNSDITEQSKIAQSEMAQSEIAQSEIIQSEEVSNEAQSEGCVLDSEVENKDFEPSMSVDADPEDVVVAEQNAEEEYF